MDVRTTSTRVPTLAGTTPTRHKLYIISLEWLVFLPILYHRDVSYRQVSRLKHFEKGEEGQEDRIEEQQRWRRRQLIKIR